MNTMDYVVMLRESLEKKLSLLELLQKRNQEQSQLLSNPDFSQEDLDINMAKKSELIEQIQILDAGFDQLFKKLEPEISSNQAVYADEIQMMQALIRRIADLTATVEAHEYKNKELAKAHFTGVGSPARQVKKSQESVANAYKSMMKPIKR